MELISISDSHEDRYGYGERLRAMSNVQLVEAYNCEIGNPGIVARRTDYLYHMRREFLSRNIDTSLIIQGDSMRLDFRVLIQDNRLVQVY